MDLRVFVRVQPGPDLGEPEGLIIGLVFLLLFFVFEDLVNEIF